MWFAYRNTIRICPIGVVETHQVLSLKSPVRFRHGVRTVFLGYKVNSLSDKKTPALAAALKILEHGRVAKLVKAPP